MEMTNIDTLAICENLTKAGLNAKIAKALANQFRLLADRQDFNKHNFLTKDEVDKTLVTENSLKITELSLKKDIEEVKLTLHNEIEEVRLTLHNEIEGVRLTLGKEIENVRYEIIESKNSMLKFMMASTVMTITILGFLIQIH